MADAVPLPWIGEHFVDARGPERAMRASYHPERGVVVLSLWSGTWCRASFQLPLDDVDRLSELLAVVQGQSTAAGDSVDSTDEVGYPGLLDADLPQAG
jgi:hypothetical protein